MRYDPQCAGWYKGIDMKFCSVCAATLLILAACASAGTMRQVTPQELAAAKGAGPELPFMHPDAATLRSWQTATQALPRARVSATREALPSRVDLLPYFAYVPEEYDQGYCGNCWIWASLGAFQMALSEQDGIAVRLSAQQCTSCFDSYFACQGGLPGTFAEYARQKGFVVPESNPNAYYQQFDAADYEAGRPAAHCHEIGDVPRYLIDYCSTYLLDTYEYDGNAVVSDTAQAETVIKQQLHQGHAVVFTLYYPDAASLDEFRTYWSDYGEDTYLDVSAWGGRTWNDEEGAGHAMLAVGYTEDAWIVLNSWGTSEGLRPNGLLAIGPIDTMDYGASYYEDGEWWPLMNWYIHPMRYKGIDSDGDNVSDADEIAAGSDPNDMTSVAELPLRPEAAFLVFAVAAACAFACRRRGSRA